MTYQVPDTVYLDGREYVLTAHGPGLWDPAAAGVSVVMASTACWRGYTCGYAIVKDRLMLEKVDAKIGRYDGEDFVALDLPVINGQRGQATSHQGFNAQYRALAVAMAYTGELVLGSDELQSDGGEIEAVPWRYRMATRLHCNAGTITGRDDISEVMSAVRTALSGADAASARDALAGAELSWLTKQLPITMR